MTIVALPSLAASPSTRSEDIAGPVVSVSQLIDWLEPRLARTAPVEVGTVRVMGVVVHDPAFTDADTCARVGWIGDGDSPQQVLMAHADDVNRYDVIVGVSWHGGVPEPRVVLVNP